MSNSIVQQKLLQLLRTNNIYANSNAARQALLALTPSVFGGKDCDGSPILARYYEGTEIKTLMGVCYYENGNFTVTVFDEGTEAYNRLVHQVSQIIESAGLKQEGDVITYVADPNCELISAATTIKDAIDILGNTVEDLDYNIVEVTPDSGETTVYKKYELIDNGGEGHGTIVIPNDRFLEKAELVQEYYKDGQLIEEPALELTFVLADGSLEVVDLPVKDLIDTTDIASDTELKALETAVGGEYVETESGSTFELNLEGDVIGSATTVVEALEALDQKMSSQSGVTPIVVDQEEGLVELNYNECENAGLQVNDNKLDVSFDFGTFDFDIVVVETVDDINAIENPSETIIVVSNMDVVPALANKTFKSITYKDNSLNAETRMAATESLSFDNVEIVGPKGSTNGAVLFNAPSASLNNVSVESGSTAYNVFEQLSNAAPITDFTANNITVDDPELKHNVFNIYRPADDAVITIKNGTFNLDMANSNVMRLANYSNATGVTLTFENIEWTYENKGYTPSDLDWAGIVIYQPASTDEALNGNLDYIKTWKFVFKNCSYNGVKVTENNFGMANQVIYLYNIARDGAIRDASQELDITFE